MDKELHLSFGSYTDTGLVKEFNTDAVVEFNILDGHVFVVCDGHNGVGGHGALASRLITESIKKYFYNRSYKDIAKALTNAITFANLALFEQAQKDEKYKGIASTLAILIYNGGQLYYAYAGDSRIYLYRNNELQPLTRDHVDDPLNAAGADVKVLIGKSKDIKFGVCKSPLNALENDVFVICTDGLTDQITEEELIEVMGDSDKSPEHKCKNLIEISKDKGGIDCVSVQVIEFSQVIELQKPKMKINFKPILYVLLGVIGIAALSFAGYKGYEAFKNRPVKAFVEEPKISEPIIIDKNLNKVAKVDDAKNTNSESSKALAKEAQKKENVEKKITQAAANNNQIYYNHIIKYGENLYRLAIKYNTTQKILIEINGSKATNMVAGTTLKIPIQAFHKVTNGESFSSISDKYNVKIKAIWVATDLNESMALKEGQTLVIPMQSK